MKEYKHTKLNEGVEGLNSWNGGGQLKIGANPEIEALAAKAIGLAHSTFKSTFDWYTIPAIGGKHIDVEGKVEGTLKIIDKAAMKKIHDMAKSN